MISFLLFLSMEVILLFSHQLRPTLCNPMDCSMAGIPVPHSQRLLKLMAIESVMPSNHLIFCGSLLLLSSTFPSTGVFSKELTLH